MNTKFNFCIMFFLICCLQCFMSLWGSEETSISSTTKLRIGVLRHINFEEAELLGINANAERLLFEAAQARGHRIEFVSPFRYLDTDGVSDYDVVISRVEVDDFTDKLTDAYLRILNYFEALGVPVINGTEAVINGQDKFRTLLRAKGAGVNVPLTLMVYSRESIYELLGAERVSFPFFVKRPYSGCGKGVFCVHDLTELASILEQNFIDGDPILVEERVDLETDENGNIQDMRTWVVRDAQTNRARFIGGTYRVAADGHYLTNLAAGGSVVAMPRPYPEDIARASELALESIGADVAGVDLARDKSGKLFLLEINIGFFTLKSMCDAIGENIWDYTIDLAEARVPQNRTL